MSGPVVLDTQKLHAALSEIEEVRRSFPESALTVLAQEVVRRVAENLAPPALTAALAPEPRPATAEIEALAMALCSPDREAAVARIEEARRRGASHDALCRAWLAEAARLLGAWWEEDRVSFYQVTIAAGRIYAILRILRLQHAQTLPHGPRRAVFAPVPGEDHTLGISIAADMARNLGWDIELLLGRDHDGLIAELTRRDTALIGLSAGSKRALPALIQLIVALRISNPGARILVCGQIARANIGLVGITGADAVSPDLDTALAEMERLLTAP